MAERIDPSLAGIAPSRGVFAAVLPAHAGQALTISLLGPVIPLLSVYLGGGKSGELSAQMVTVVPFLGIMAGGIASGWVMKAVGLRSFVVLAAILFAVSGGIGLVAQGLPLLLAGGLLLGFAAIFVLTGLSSVTSLAYPPAERNKVIGLQAGLGGLSSIVFGLGAAVLAERFGWRVPFAVFVSFGFVVLTLTLLFIPSTAREDNQALIAMGEIVRRIWPAMLAAGLAFMLIASQATQLPFLMAEKGIGSSALRGVVLTTLAAMSMLGSISYGPLQQRVGERGLILVIGFAGIAAWVIFGLWSGGLGWAMMGAGLIGTAQGVLVPMLFGSVMRAVPADVGGPAIGLLNAAICFGSFLNPLLSSPVRDAAGLSGLMFVLAAITGAILVVAMAWPALSSRRAGQRMA